MVGLQQSLHLIEKKQQVTLNLTDFIKGNNNKFPTIKILRNKLRKFDDLWNSHAPVRDDVFRKLKSEFIDSKKPIKKQLRQL